MADLEDVRTHELSIQVSNFDREFLVFHKSSAMNNLGTCLYCLDYLLIIQAKTVGSKINTAQSTYRKFGF